MHGRRWRDTAVARASDDFYPRDPASSTPHISACAFLSLFLSPLVQPDWDMFHRCGCWLKPQVTANSLLVLSHCFQEALCFSWQPLGIKPGISYQTLC